LNIQSKIKVIVQYILSILASIINYLFTYRSNQETPNTWDTGFNGSYVFSIYLSYYRRQELLLRVLKK